MEGDNIALPVLDGKNYTKWKLRMQSILEAKELDDLVYGSTMAKITTADDSTENDPNKEDSQEVKPLTAEERAIKVRAARAKMILTNAVDDKHTTIIAPYKTAREMWNRLEQEYSDRTPTNVQGLLAEYYSSKMESSQTTSEYVAYIESLVDRLKEAKQEIKPDQVIAKIVSALPAEYSSFRRSWDMLPDSFRTKSLLITNLKKESTALAAPQVKGEALVAKSDRPRQNRHKKRYSKSQIKEMKQNSVCSHCKRPGHWYKECPNNQQAGESSKQTAIATPKQIKGVVMMALTEYNNDKLSWFLDSGASEHMTDNRQWFDTYESIVDPYPIRIGDGSYLYAVGRGSIKAVSIVDGEEIEITLSNVQYVPHITSNLFSIGAADAVGIDVTFGNGKVALSKNSEIVATGTKVAAQIYKLNIQVPLHANIARSERTIEEWHRILGHASTNQIQEMARNGLVDGMVIVDTPRRPLINCGDCQSGKVTAASHPHSDRPRATNILQRIHMDLVGPITPTSLGGASYFVLMKDEFSSCVFVSVVARKSDVPKAIMSFVNKIEIISQGKVKIIRSDNGSEFKNRSLSDFYSCRGIIQEFSCPYTPQQNGEAERANRTIIETARSMLQSSNLDLALWAESVSTAVYVRNRTINSRSNGKTPFELFYGRKPDLSHLVPFGQQVHIKNHGNLESKFSAKTIEAFFVGYGDRVNTYRCFVPTEKDVRITSDMIIANHKTKQISQSNDSMSTVIVTGVTNQPSSLTEPHKKIAPSQQQEIVIDLASPTLEQCHDQQREIEEASTLNQNITFDVAPQAERDSASYQNLSYCPQYENNETQDISSTATTDKAPTVVTEQSSCSHTKRASQTLSGPKMKDVIYCPQGSILRRRDPINNTLVPSTRSRHVVLTPGHQIITNNRPNSNTAFEIDWKNPSESFPLQRQSMGTRNRSHIQVNSHIDEAFRPKMKASAPTRYNLSATSMNNEPQSYHDAITCTDKNGWLEAIKEELNAHQQNGTWKVVPLPKNVKEITAKWIFKIKDQDIENNKRYKARLVARGFSQVEGIDYGEIFSPVVRMDSIRLLFAIVAQFELQFVQFDITTAFLNGFIKEELYLSPPEGLDVPVGHSCKLLRSLYGLKQSPRCWNERFKSILTSFQMKQSVSDPCVFVSTKVEPLYLALYVDDGLIIAKSSELIQSLLNHLKQDLKVKTINSKCFLGLEINHNIETGSVFLHQSRYISKILHRFNMANSNPSKSPLPASHALNQREVLETDIVTNVPYSEALGSLMYCAMGTRPDIAYSISVLSKYSACPRNAHWEAIKRVFRYLKGTLSKGLFYIKVQDPQLVCYTDADWAGDQDSRKSISGMVSLINTAAISYKAQQQPVVSLSTTEAEYIAGNEGAKEIVWLSRFINELGVKFEHGPLLLGDNQGALKLIKNPEFHQRTKHIDIKYHFIREKFEEGIFDLAYVQTDKQKADLFTKALSSDRHQTLCKLIGCLSIVS